MRKSSVTTSPAGGVETEGHVEVEADEDTLALERPRVLEEREASVSRGPSRYADERQRSTSRFEYPHSLSYQPKILTSVDESSMAIAIVRVESKVQEAALPTMSLETIWSSL